MSEEEKSKFLAETFVRAMEQTAQAAQAGDDACYLVQSQGSSQWCVKPVSEKRKAESE